mgnify:CR=1 FL=1
MDCRENDGWLLDALNEGHSQEETPKIYWTINLRCHLSRDVLSKYEHIQDSCIANDSPYLDKVCWFIAGLEDRSHIMSTMSPEQ